MTEHDATSRCVDEAPTKTIVTSRASRRRVLGEAGPGLVTGAADDDPSGIATYSQVGAQFGYQMGWTMTLAFPLMSAIQEMCARIGSHHRPRHRRPISGRTIRAGVLDGLVLLAASSPTRINLGADIAAMGEAAKLSSAVRHATYGWSSSRSASLIAEIFLSYARYASILKWLTLSLLRLCRGRVHRHMPTGAPGAARRVRAWLAFTGASMTALVVASSARRSVPISSSGSPPQEVEELARKHQKPLYVTPKTAGPELRRIRIDTLVGMFFSDLMALFIIYATAATLHTHGITHIDTSVQAAQALRPSPENSRASVFAIGIIGTGLLALPVLAGSASYAVCEAFRWNTGLDRKPKQARAFYAVIAGAMLLGVGSHSRPSIR